MVETRETPDIRLRLARTSFRDNRASVVATTENGAASEAIASVASGPEDARNYLQKSFIWAKAEGYLGVDWFTLSDGANAADAFSRMGLYEDEPESF